MATWAINIVIYPLIYHRLEKMNNPRKMSGVRGAAEARIQYLVKRVALFPIASIVRSIFFSQCTFEAGDICMRLTMPLRQRQLCWTFPLINRIQNMADGANPIFELYVLHCITGPLQVSCSDSVCFMCNEPTHG